MKKRLKIDDKWAVEYDPENNDLPTALYRYDEKHNYKLGTQPNYVLSMFYRILYLEDLLRSEGINV